MNIAHFMWGYQPHFRSQEEHRSARLFRALDKRFSPEVFLVGVLVDGRKDVFPACVEPEDDFWIESNELDGILKLADAIRREDPESQLHQSHPLAQEWQDERIFKRSIQQAITNAVNTNPRKPPTMRYFVSFPVRIQSYLVSLVLGLQSEILNAHPSLTVNRLAIHKYRSFSVATSLLDAAISVYLADVAVELQRPDPGAGMGAATTDDEIIRAAGNKLMTDLAAKTEPDLLRRGYATSVFERISQIAATKYENAAGLGQVVLARHDHPALQSTVAFRTQVDLGGRRGARKLLELAAKGALLHVDVKSIYGLVELDPYDFNTEDLYTINMVGHHCWDLTHASRVLMQVKFGEPSLPVSPFDETRLCDDIPRVFGRISQEQIGRLVAMVRVAVAEKHGTMLLISKKAAQEAERLSSQSTPLVPCSMSETLLRHLTSIDGAVLLDLDGVCHAIGVILDGVATEKGDSARGARFNSAVRYVLGRPEGECIAVVVSEDGGVDMVPSLRRAILRAEIDNRIVELESLLKAAKLSRRRFVRHMNWLEEHEFYLMRNDCLKLNKVGRAFEKRTRAEYPTGISVSPRIFRPSRDLVPSRDYRRE